MEGGGFCRGSNQEQDSRFADKTKKLIKTTKFPKHMEQKVDIKKVQLEAMAPWIGKRITEMLGTEDDILIGFIMAQLEDEKNDAKVHSLCNV